MVMASTDRDAALGPVSQTSSSCAARLVGRCRRPARLSAAKWSRAALRNCSNLSLPLASCSISPKQFSAICGIRLLGASGAQKKHMTAELSQINRKIEQLIERLLTNENETVIPVYEDQIGKLESDKRVLGEKIAKCGTPIATYDDSFRTAMAFFFKPLESLEFRAGGGQENGPQTRFRRHSCLLPETRHSNAENCFAFQGLDVHFRRKRGNWRARNDSNVRPSDS